MVLVKVVDLTEENVKNTKDEKAYILLKGGVDTGVDEIVEPYKTFASTISSLVNPSQLWKLYEDQVHKLMIIYKNIKGPSLTKELDEPVEVSNLEQEPLQEPTHISLEELTKIEPVKINEPNPVSLEESLSKKIEPPKTYEEIREPEVKSDEPIMSNQQMQEPHEPILSKQQMQEPDEPIMSKQQMQEPESPPKEPFDIKPTILNKDIDLVNREPKNENITKPSMKTDIKPSIRNDVVKEQKILSWMDYKRSVGIDGSV